MAIVCVVLGLWGAWDYAVAIPNAITEADRAELIKLVLPALDVELGSEERDAATVALNVAIEEDSGVDVEWGNALFVFGGAVSGNGSVGQQEAINLLEEYLNKYGNVTRPSKYDRPMQWMFILCLPFGFYYLGVYGKMSKRAGVYCLDDDGTLTTPEGSWTSNEIKDIDMGRWISKTAKARETWKARVVVDDHAPIVLDDYIYKDMHLIIGKLAHQFYPEQWTPLAKRVRVEKTEESEETGNGE